MLLDLMRERSSVRNFDTEKEPGEHEIGCILEAARLAPSWINVQPWHFIVIKDKIMKTLLSKLAPGQGHIEQAPVIIACCADLNCFDYDNYRKILESRPGITQERLNRLLNNPALNPSLKGDETVKLRALEELTYAIAYMTLEAQEHNVATCIVGGIGNEYTGATPDVYSVVREELGLPDNVYLATLLLLGYPSSEFNKNAKQRKDFEEIVSYEKYGSKTS